MTRQEHLRAQRDLFRDCDRCNRAMVAALDQGSPLSSLGGLFQQKESLLRLLEAQKPLPAGGGLDPDDLTALVGEVAQAQAQAIRSESLLYAALQPQIPYNGKRINPYQQNSGGNGKNALEREG